MQRVNTDSLGVQSVERVNIRLLDANPVVSKMPLIAHDLPFVEVRDIIVVCG